MVLLIFACALVVLHVTHFLFFALILQLISAVSTNILIANIGKTVRIG